MSLPAMAAQKVASPKAGDRKVVPVMVPDEAVQVQEMHVLAVDDSVVDRAVIAKILRNSKYRGKFNSFLPNQSSRRATNFG
jgi:two-component response regulator (ARR-A family)